MRREICYKLGTNKQLEGENNSTYIAVKKKQLPIYKILEGHLKELELHFYNDQYGAHFGRILEDFG